jgi:hypothetical protein
MVALAYAGARTFAGREWHESHMDSRGVFRGEGDESIGTSRAKLGEPNCAGVHP